MAANNPPTAYYPPPAPAAQLPPAAAPFRPPPPAAYTPPNAAVAQSAPAPHNAAPVPQSYRPPTAFTPPSSFPAPPPAAGAFTPSRPAAFSPAPPSQLSHSMSPAPAPASAVGAASPLPPPAAAFAPPTGLSRQAPARFTPPAPPAAAAAAAASFAPPAVAGALSRPLPAAAAYTPPPLANGAAAPAGLIRGPPTAFAPPPASTLPPPQQQQTLPQTQPPQPQLQSQPLSQPFQSQRPGPPQQLQQPQQPQQQPMPSSQPLPPPSHQQSPLPPPSGLQQQPRGLPPPAASALPAPQQPSAYSHQPPPQHPTYPSAYPPRPGQPQAPQPYPPPQQNGHAPSSSPLPSMLHPLPSPTSNSAAYPPPHSLPPPNFPASSHPPPQSAYSNGYGEYADMSQQSSTATTPYSSGANSPAFASHHPHSSSYPPPQLQSSASAPPANAARKVDRIDPKQIPRPADLKSSTATIRYYTRSGLSPPSSTADFVAIDEGNCSPRFVRLTTNNIAHEPELIETTRLSIGAVIQPLAPLAEGEEAVPVIDYATGPVRCGRCMAYVNPFFQFTDGGASFICSICQMKGDVPADYRCNLDANGLRRDRQERAELCRGSVEYVVGKDFLTRPVQEPCYLFCIDVSYAAVMSGLTAAAVDAIRHSLQAMKGSERLRAGVMTYDAACHFYALSPPRTEPVMYVMSDVDDVFLPCPAAEILVPLSSPPHLGLLLQLLDMIPVMYNRDTRDDEHTCSFGAAVSVAAECVMETGGKVLLTVSSLPTQGAGALQMRDNIALYHTEKERTLQQPSSSFYHTVATRCAEHAISIDLFVCANAYVDLATLSALSDKTGGQVFMYPGFSARKDGLAFQQDLYHDVTRYTGYDAVMIVRVSNGLRVAEQYGNFFHRSASEMDLPAIDSDKTFAVRIEHDGNSKLKDKSEACIQAALLYTTPAGQRRIRVHTLAAPVTSVMSNVYRFSDLDAIVNLSLKQAVRQLLDNTTTAEAQAALTSACIDSLFVYRKYCASATSAGQLILPEPLKLLPLCTLGMIKHPLLQDGVSADERSYLYSFINSMPCYVSVAFVIPRLYSLHDLPSHVCLYDEKGRASLPPSLSLSSESISSSGLYLLDDARFLYMYVGAELSAAVVQAVFDPQWTLRPAADDPTSLPSRIAVLVQVLRLQKSNYQPLQVVSRRIQGGVNGETLDESLFSAHMIEDAGRGRGAGGALGQPGKDGKGGGRGSEANAMSYIDFLCWIHKKIQAKFY